MRPRKKNLHLPQNVYVRRGKYQLRYPDGKTRVFPDLQDCLSEWGKVYTGTPTDRISDIILSYRAKELPKRAPRTQKDYLADLLKVEKVFGKMRVGDIKPRHVYKYQDMRAEQGAKVHVNREIAVLSVICSHAIRLGHIDVNPCREVRRRPERPRRRYVRDDELFIVYNLSPAWLRKAIVLACITGMRRGDILRLGPDNITKDGLLYEQGKTGRRLLIEWTDELKRVAVRPHVSAEGFSSAWRRAMTKAESFGVERFRFHDLRAKAGSHATDWRLLGHTNQDIFERVYNRAPIRIKV